MMATRRYTLEQLHSLRESPLVQKPDNLPAIEQWIDESQKQQQQQRQSRPAHTGDASPMGNFSAGQQRPGLVGRSGTGSRTGDDVSLGPPRTVFASSRSTTRLSDLPPDSTTTEEGEGSRRFGGDRQSNRKSGTQEGEGRFSRDSWTTARDKRLANAEEDTGDRARFGRRDRDKDHEADRRNGFGDRQDPRWARDGGRTNGDRVGGWRGRDKPRQERDWDRSGPPDKEPEWMDDPGSKDDGDLGSMSMPKNQEDFEKWKQAQHARNKKHTDEPAKVEEAPPPEPSPPPKPAAMLKLDTLPTQSFHEWGKRITSEGTPDSAGTPAKSAAPGKTKASRFMPMFKKDEAKDEAPLASPPPQNMNGSAEDKEGFQRILQMLGGTGISQNPTPPQSQPPSQPPSQPQPPSFEPASPQARQVSGGSKKSRFTGFFDQIPKSPEPVQSPPVFPPEQHRPFSQEPGNVYGGRQHEHQNSLPGNAPPEPPTSAGGFRDHRPQTGSLNGIFLDKPPSRGAATPDINIQNLLASQRQRPQGPDKNSEFLLNLLQNKGSSRPPSQQATAEPNFPLWLDQPPNATEPHAPKPRVPPPPGHFEDQLLRNAQGGPPRPPQQQAPNHDMLQRRTSQQRVGPGFMDEQLFLQQQQQRRNFPEQPPQPNRRVQPNMGPQMQHNPMLQYPPEFLQSPSALSQGPPPGFNPHMARHPPGIHNGPNIFQAPQAQRDPQPQQLPPQPPPPGFGGPNGPPPPGFFAGPPPGFMQMRSPTGNGRGFEGMEGMGQRR